VLLACATLLPGCSVWRGYLGPLLGAEPSPAAFVDDLHPGSLRAAVARMAPMLSRRRLDQQLMAARRLAGVVDATNGDRVRREMDMHRTFGARLLEDGVLVTGYYAPEIPASRVRTPEYRFPILARPPELRDGVPFLTRAQIDGGALAGRGLEIAWARDAIDLLYLQIQGSGRARFPDGTTVGLLFAGTNSRPYTSLGKTMIDRGLLTLAEASPGGIRRALALLPPATAAALLHTNERYVFFRADDGPVVGSLGAPLTDGRSVAVDPTLIPPGSVLYLETPSFRRFVIAQDTGAAITGAHADLFIGAGADAGRIAGALREHGRLWIMDPR
jgi:membrane-bound lytic murein transglycosylase